MKGSLSIAAFLLHFTKVKAWLPNVVIAPETFRSASFSWDTTPDSHEDLHYHDCYDKFQCARLSVPLDWQDIDSRNNVSLAIVKLPAIVPESDPRHGGTIVLNPGGPGGSGILWALQIAQKVQRLLDGPKFYEILSFDPRGVFLSTPNAYCFDSAVESEIWYAEKRAAGALTTSEYALKYNWVSEEARGQLCATSSNGRFEDGSNIRQHVSTASVARDMLHIVNKVDEHRWDQQRITNHEQEVMMDSVPRPLPKLQYIGTSYGTFLGHTFASMFPQSVGTMVLDGNVDPDNWVSRFEAGVQDNRATRTYFFDRCFAGKERCAFWKEDDRSSDDIEYRFDALLTRLEKSPGFVIGNGRAMPVTAADVRQGFFTAVYQPLQFFEPYADFLHKISVGINPGQPFWQRPIPTRDTFSDELLANVYLAGEVSPAVHCSDGPDLADAHLHGFETYLANLTSEYGWTGDLQAHFKISCWSWPSSLRTRWRFDGPFNGSVPIMFVNTRLDPVCPIRNARKMAQRFEGSVVLELDSVGHGALWPATPCMWDRVKAFFDNGTLPLPDTVCPANCEPFGDGCDEEVAVELSWH